MWRMKFSSRLCSDWVYWYWFFSGSYHFSTATM